jgi:mono/diheme cytochrome c family protein
MIRGRLVRERLLCQPIQEPLEVPELPDASKAKNGTKRERLAVHRTEPSCAACHNLLDPPGLALENFDAIGAYRMRDEDGSVIDATGDLDGIPFDGAKGLGDALLKHEQFAACVTTLFYRTATNHEEEVGELPAIKQLTTDFEKNGRRIKPLLLSIVTSDAFTKFAAR